MNWKEMSEVKELYKQLIEAVEDEDWEKFCEAKLELHELSEKRKHYK